MSSLNLYARWRELFEAGPLQVGEVAAYADGVATITLPGGAMLHAHGEATVGTKVYVRDAVILGPAPDLPVDSGEV